MPSDRFLLAQQDSGDRWGLGGDIRLIWTDPPFGTGKTQEQRGASFRDVEADEAASLTVNAICKMIPYLRPDGVVCVLADYRIIHEVVTDLKAVLCHRGDVIWSFGLGRPRTCWWPNRHNTIATFSKRSDAKFDATQVPRERRKAPKAGYGADKPSGSVWDKTLSNTDPERVGYPNQKPLDIIEPFILAHTDPGDIVADPFMGSGSTGHAALKHGRRFLGQDTNPEALAIVEKRLEALR